MTDRREYYRRWRENNAEHIAQYERSEKRKAQRRERYLKIKAQKKAARS
jgi:hypothetical protein